MKVTGFIGVYSDDSAAKIDAYGNNVAFLCSACGHPVLAVVREHQRGSSADKPAKCLSCNKAFVIEVREQTQKVVIYCTSEL